VLTLSFKLTREEFNAIWRRLAVRRVESWILTGSGLVVAVGGAAESDGSLIAMGAGLAGLWFA
jgi:hypothetical protein